MTLPFLAQEPVEHSVSGSTQKFWPISVAAMFRLRGLAKPVAKAVAAFLSTTSKDDTGSEHSTVNSQQGSQTRVSVQPITPELAKVRFEQRQQSIETIMEGLLNEQSSRTLADMVMDSMREAYASRKPGDLDEFLKQVPAPVFVEMLAGVAKANKKLFDPLKERAAEITAALKSSLPAAPAAMQPEPSPDSETTTQSG